MFWVKFKMLYSMDNGIRRYYEQLQREGLEMYDCLDYGADPNGVPRIYLAEHARGYRNLIETSKADVEAGHGWIGLRGSLRVEDVVDASQQTLLSPGQKAKNLAGISIFWHESSLPLPCVPNYSTSPFIVAVETGSMEVLRLAP